MFGFEFKGLTELQKGYISLFFGSVLLLHSLNIFREWLNGIVILAALFLLAYGVVTTGIIQTIAALIQREKKSESL